MLGLVALEAWLRPTAMPWGLSLERDHRYFVQGQNGIFRAGVATRYAFAKRDVNLPLDDLNVSGPPAPRPYAKRWVIAPGPRGTPSPSPAAHRFTIAWAEESGNYADRQQASGLAISAKAVALAFILLLAAGVGLQGRTTWRRRRAWRGGRCLSCNYDLRATSDRCPECGAPTAPRPARLMNRV